MEKVNSNSLQDLAYIEQVRHATSGGLENINTTYIS